MAIKTQTSLLKAESARAAAKTITGITAASPPVVTSTSHGYANGDIVYIDGVVGMDQVNGKAFVVANQATNTFELKGVDGTNFTAYTSGGSAYKITLTTVGEVRNIANPGAKPNKIDVTHLRSTSKSYLPGLSDNGDMTADLWAANSDTGQILLRKLNEEGSTGKVFTVTDSASAVACFVGSVDQFGFNAQQDAAYEAPVAFSISSRTWFA